LNAPSIPYDFGETRDGHVLRTLMVQFVEQNGPTVVPPLLNVTREIVAEITNCPVSLPIKNIVDPSNLDFDVGELNRLLRLYSRLHSHLAVLQSIYNQTTNMQGRPNVAHTVPFSVSENVEMLTSIGEVIRFVSYCDLLIISREIYWRGNQLLRSLPKKYRDALPLDQLDGNGRRRSDKTELPDDLFMKKHGFPRRDPTYRNVEMLQYIVSFLPKKVLKFFAGTPRYILGSCTGLSNSLVTRAKLSDLTQRTTALTVLDCLSDIFLDLLRNGDAQKEGQTIDLHLYWFCVTNFIHSILGGGRYPDDVVDFVGVEAGQPGYDKSLQTLLLSRFHSKGGLAALLDITKSLAESLPSLDKDNPADNERLLAIPANLKKLFSLIRLFTTDSIINESPQSGYLTNRDRHKDQGHYFLVSTFLTDTRATCLPVLTDLLSLLNKLDKVTTQLLLTTLCDLILGGPEEFHSDAGKYENEPEEDSLHRLSQHGFDRGHAYAALMAHGNVEAAALEYLLSRRNVVPPPQPGDMSRSPSPPFQAGMDEFVEHRALPFPPLPGQPVNPQGDTHAMDIDPSADTHMDIDPPNPEATSSSSVDKGKAVEIVETRVETLARLRTEFSGNLENYVTDILVYHPDLPFELARLIKSVGKWESNEWIQERMLELAARLASLEDDKRTKAKEIAACAHVLGLLLSEKRYYDNAEAGIVVFLDSFVGFLSVEKEIETPWISSVSLIIEIIVREIEWRQCKKRQDPAFNLDIPEIEPEFYRRLLDKLIDILKSDLADETVILCVLRLLVHLTRDGQYARVFREKNGIQSLLQLNYRHAGKTTFKVTDPTIIIIRQIVEDDKIVLATMRSVVQSVLDVGANRGRYVDLSELLRNKHAEVLRDPNLFSHAVEQLAKLVGWSSSNPNSHKLSKKQPEQTVAYPPKPENDVQVKDTKPDLPETPKKSTLELSYSSGVVQILLTELLSHHADATPSTKKEEAPISTNTGLAQGTDSNNAPPNQSRTKLTPEEAKEYAYTLFLLQALSELVGSYNNCKLEFVNYSRRGQSREPLTPSKPRSMMLNYLLNDLLPTGVASYTVHASQDMDLERRRGISQLVSSVISSLCKKTPEFYGHDDRPDLLVNVRKFVLEGIARSLKETLASTGPAQQRYSRYTSLAELCRKLLASQMPLPMAQMQIDVASSSEMAKLMFEKGFVGLLTSVVAEIELDFPDVRLVINDVLSSLRDLTTSINRLAATSSFDAGSATGDVEEISTASSVSEEEEMQDRDETPDVFRNSALGILQGEVEDNGHRNHNHHHHLDYQEYDEVMDYDDDDDDDDEDDDEDLESESGSDDSEMDEEDGDDEMNVHPTAVFTDNDRFALSRSLWMMEKMKTTTIVTALAICPMKVKIWKMTNLTGAMKGLMVIRLSICLRNSKWRIK
jgi:E3 ubiquitin-protein ligase HUWE1